VKKKFKIGNKVKIAKDIPNINGMLYKDSIVKIDEISSGSPFRGSVRVIDSVGKIWWISREDITNV